LRHAEADFETGIIRSFAKAMALSKMKPRGDRDDIYRKMVAEQTVA
jgi:hypothetical protein